MNPDNVVLRLRTALRILVNQNDSFSLTRTDMDLIGFNPADYPSWAVSRQHDALVRLAESIVVDAILKKGSS